MKLLIYLVVLCAALLSFGCLSNRKTPSKKHLSLVYNELVYKSNVHAAFTSLINYNNTLFVAFREGPIHNPSNVSEYGHIKLIKRINDVNKDTIFFKCDTADLRDPYLLNINGTPRLYCFYTQRKPKNEQRYGGTIYYDYKNGKWSDLKKINLPESNGLNIAPNYILWKIRQFEDSLYSIAYHMKHGPILFKSADGINWEVIKKISDNGNYTEGDLIEIGNNFYGILRNEDSVTAHSLIINRKNDSKSFLPRTIASPELCRIDSNIILCAGREYDFMANKSRHDSINVSILMLDDNLCVQDKLVIPGSRLGDKGYPSFSLRNDTVYMTYYFGTHSQADIYLAKMLVQE